MHGATRGNIAHDELGRSASGNGDAAGGVRYIVADRCGIELAGGGVLGIDGLIRVDGDVRADGNDLSAIAWSGRSRAGLWVRDHQGSDIFNRELVLHTLGIGEGDGIDACVVPRVNLAAAQGDDV